MNEALMNILIGAIYALTFFGISYLVRNSCGETINCWLLGHNFKTEYSVTDKDKNNRPDTIGYFCNKCGTRCKSKFSYTEVKS